MQYLLRVFVAFSIVVSLQLPAMSQSAANLSWYQDLFKLNMTSDEALASLEDKLEIASREQDLAQVAQLSCELGIIQLSKVRNHEKAMDYFIRALSLSDSLRLPQLHIFTYLGMAQVYEDIGDHLSSIETLEAVEQKLKGTDDQETLCYVLNKLGRNNAAVNRLEEAANGYTAALEEREHISQNLVADIYFNLGQLQLLQKKNSEALENLKEALQITRASGEREKEAETLNAIGELYLLMDNTERAFANHKAALEVRQVLKDKKGMAQSYANIADLYFRQQNFERAVANAELALAEARETNAQEYIKQGYEVLYRCFKAQGDFQRAARYTDDLISITEFIEREKSERQLLVAQHSFAIEQKQYQIRELERVRAEREKEIQQQRKVRNLLAALVGLAGIVVVLVTYLYISIRGYSRKLQVVNTTVQQQNVSLQELNATKDKFFSIISHDLKGPLNSLTSFSGLLINHTDSLSKDEIRMLAKDLDKSLKNLFALLENLLEWSRSQTGAIEFKPEVFDLKALLLVNHDLLSAQAQQKRIELRVYSTPDVMVNAHKHSINTVIRNLVSNAIKFTKDGGVIKLQAKRSGGEVIVSITDNGVGMGPEVLEKLFRIDTKHSTRGTADEKGTGLGLILCKDFVEKNGGRIWVESQVGKGSVFSFTVPLAAVTAEVAPA